MSMNRDSVDIPSTATTESYFISRDEVHNGHWQVIIKLRIRSKIVTSFTVHKTLEHSSKRNLTKKCLVLIVYMSHRAVKTNCHPSCTTYHIVQLSLV